MELNGVVSQMTTAYDPLRFSPWYYAAFCPVEVGWDHVPLIRAKSQAQCGEVNQRSHQTPV
jgi:hypothetical protein